MQPLWGLVWAVTQVSQAGCAAGAEPGVLEPYQQDGFFSSQTSFLTLIGSLGPWE